MAATGLLITGYLASALAAGVVAGAVAPKKKRHQGFWTTLAFLAPPLVFILLSLPQGTWTPARSEPEWDDDTDRF